MARLFVSTGSPKSDSEMVQHRMFIGVQSENQWSQQDGHVVIGWLNRHLVLCNRENDATVESAENSQVSSMCSGSGG